MARTIAEIISKRKAIGVFAKNFLLEYQFFFSSWCKVI